MTQFGTPGVYVDETRGARTIEGVATSTTAFLGMTARGPLRPRLVTSFGEYRRWFGGDAGPLAHLPYCARGFFENGGQRLFVARIVSHDATMATARLGSHFRLEALGPGCCGRRIYARVDDSTRRSPDGQPEGFRLSVAYYSSEPASDPQDWFSGSAMPAPEEAEDFDNLTLDGKSADHWEERLSASVMVRLVRDPSVPPETMPDPGFYQLDEGGEEGASPPGVDDFAGQATPARGELQGLAALSQTTNDEVSLVYAPGVSFDIARRLVEYCESVRHCFAIIDGPAQPGMNFDPRSSVADSSRAALYVPWLLINDPAVGSTPRRLPPGGHVAGIYARADRERGVHKAPANEALVGVLGLTAAINNQRQDSLNPSGVNVVREFAGRGLLVWGARTLSSDTELKYVNVRRLLIYLEHSIERGIKWVVFEPNDERLWTRVGDTVRNFLSLSWRDGALQGRSEREAFYVKCDRTTMTQDDITQGRLICEVGIAVVRPAEFVILRFMQRTGCP